MSGVTFFPAAITDVLRCYQHDASFVGELQDYVSDTFRLIFGNGHRASRRYVPTFANAWYYLLTSVGDLQTLGEEYTGVIRTRNDSIPSKFVQILWSVLYIGGENLLEKFLVLTEKQLSRAEGFTVEEKQSALKVLTFLKENRHIISRLHQSIFYMKGTYPNVANRLTRMKYVMLRPWLEENGATASFNVLGKVSFVYLLFLLVEKYLSQRNVTVPVIADSPTKATMSSKVCILCMDNCRDVCATPCGHLFCWDCVHESLTYQTSCAVCREPISPSRIVYLQNYM